MGWANRLRVFFFSIINLPNDSKQSSQQNLTHHLLKYLPFIGWHSNESLFNSSDYLINSIYLTLWHSKQQLCFIAKKKDIGWFFKILIDLKICAVKKLTVIYTIYLKCKKKIWTVPLSKQTLAFEDYNRCSFVSMYSVAIIVFVLL